MSETMVHLHTATEHFDPDSSLIYCSFRDAETNAVGVGFHGNEENFYVYSNVAPEIWAAFKNANSAGSFYNSYIKGQYPSTVVDVEEIDWTPVTDEDEADTLFAASTEVYNLVVGDRVRYIGSWYNDNDIKNVLGTVTQVETDDPLSVYDYRVAFDGIDQNGYGRLCNKEELELVVPEVAPAEPETPAQTFLPGVGTKVRINSLFEGDSTLIGLDGEISDLDTGHYDFYVRLNGNEQGRFAGYTLPVWVREVSPVEAPQVPNPLAVDGDRSFEITVRFVIDEAVDADQAVAFLRNDIPVEAEVVFVQEIAPA